MHASYQHASNQLPRTGSACRSLELMGNATSMGSSHSASHGATAAHGYQRVGHATAGRNAHNSPHGTLPPSSLILGHQNRPRREQRSTTHVSIAWPSRRSVQRTLREFEIRDTAGTPWHAPAFRLARSTIYAYTVPFVLVLRATKYRLQ